ncbi:hypothetical protein B0675_26255 [Streptomyces sp. M41(2017)]|uniref:hypothetical protein n=1 Tax=Streptomyces sp. M41(2017) TaxID=1955065 RepID=UPI0009BF9E29|nr:hypothetical protein [Streptomyces sp. M41(2017)]OQQ13757.1 hypothetical protein B0675_26255 [Streptomyces sp. M41(2017)]
MRLLDVVLGILVRRQGVCRFAVMVALFDVSSFGIRDLTKYLSRSGLGVLLAVGELFLGLHAFLRILLGGNGSAAGIRGLVQLGG